MKKTITLTLSLLVILQLSFLQAQEIKKNVLDYFLMVPSSLWDINRNNYSESQKHKMIDEKDIKNGWLKFSGKDSNSVWEGWGEFVIFKRPDLTYMPAVSVYSCGPLCEQTLSFFSFSGTSWRNITDEVIKPLSRAQLSEKYKSVVGKDEFTDDPPVSYVLPRFGTSISVITQVNVTGKEVVLFTYTYQEGKFVLKP